MDERWPELERTITQYDKATGMLEMYRLTRDVTAAAGWPENMAYQVRDLILQKLADSKIQANFRSGGTFFKEPDQSAYESMGREIVDALLRDEKTEPIPFKDVAFKPRVHLEPKTKPVGRDPYVRPDDLAHCKSCGSRHHSTAHCPHRGQPVV